ncbi:MAG: pantoate kinase [Thermoplasmata archaeon]
MALRGRAFCPGHITAFFQICEDEDPLKMGSRGAGLCLSKGVLTSVEAREASRTRIDVHLKGRPGPSEVTERALDLFMEEPMEVVVDSEVQLPVSQGFAMSGAGALSSLLALNDALGGPRGLEELVAIAHQAELECRTGLGDVYPQSLGGLDIRERPGVPPHGLVHTTTVDSEVILCILGPPLSTRAMLANEMIVRSVNGVGRRCVDRFLLKRDLSSFFRLAYQFARQTLLASSAIQGAVIRASLHGRASMCMLGNSIFAMGEVEELQESLAEEGDIYRVQVDNSGARVL